MRDGMVNSKMMGCASALSHPTAAEKEVVIVESVIPFNETTFIN